MGVEGTVIPTRFLTLVGHLTAIAMLYTTRVRHCWYLFTPSLP